MAEEPDDVDPQAKFKRLEFSQQQMVVLARAFPKGHWVREGALAVAGDPATAWDLERPYAINAAEFPAVPCVCPPISHGQGVFSVQNLQQYGPKSRVMAVYDDLADLLRLEGRPPAMFAGLRVVSHKSRVPAVLHGLVGHRSPLDPGVLYFGNTLKNRPVVAETRATFVRLFVSLFGYANHTAIEESVRYPWPDEMDNDDPRNYTVADRPRHCRELLVKWGHRPWWERAWRDLPDDELVARVTEVFWDRRRRGVPDASPQPGTSRWRHEQGDQRQTG